MILTKEKAEKLTEYLVEDLERAKILFALPLSKAVDELKSDGLDYTEEELKEYAEYIQISLSEKNSEFDESNLEGVSGGFGTKSDFAIFATLQSNGIYRWI